MVAGQASVFLRDLAFVVTPALMDDSISVEDKVALVRGSQEVSLSWFQFVFFLTFGSYRVVRQPGHASAECDKPSKQICQRPHSGQWFDGGLQSWSRTSQGRDGAEDEQN
jgi:hypothetical protein